MASESCTKEGSTRTDTHTNAIQVCYRDGQERSWLYVCMDNWNIFSLEVYCRQAGGSEFNGNISSSGTVESSLRVKLRNCTGNESSLLECGYSVTDSNCLYARVNKSGDCRKCSNCSGEYCADGMCVCSTNCTRGVCIQKCEYNKGTDNNHKVIIPLVAVGTAVFTVSVLTCAASALYHCRMNRRSRDTSTTDIRLHILTIKDSTIEDNVKYIGADSSEILVNYWSVTHHGTVIQNATAELDTYLVPNVILNRDEYCSIESELYGVLVEGEVADYDKYDRLSQINAEVYEELTLKYQSIFPNHETASNATNSIYRSTSAYIEPPTSLPQLETVFEHCFNEINRGEIEMGEEFASGQFGVVYRAVYHTQRGDIPVAIKTLKEASDTDTKVAFMREAAILAQFQHPNVLRLIGVLTAQQPYMMVTELLKTELAELLLKFKALQPTTHGSSSSNGTNLSAQKLNLPPLLLRFAQEISAGMEHLSEKHFIHRDLAARNVLVAKDLSCRIADFGMSRELLSDSEYYTSSGGRIPLRWTAPEAVFYQKYSEKSDVWSFGMTLFEIWSLGEKPWGNDATNEEIIEGLSDGRKLSPPTGCPRDVYSVMVETWRMDSSCRPTFSTILHLLTNIHLSIASPPVSPETDPSLCLGNDPLLARGHYPDLQQVY